MLELNDSLNSSGKILIQASGNLTEASDGIRIYSNPLAVLKLEGKFGVISEHIGEFKLDRGKLSESSIVLQDNLKYQQYSYVVTTSESILLWGNLLKQLIHPAGYGVYSESLITVKAKTPTVSYKVINNLSCSVKATVSINSIIRNYSTIIRTSSSNGVGYNRYSMLRRLEPNIPPIKTLNQISVDLQDSTYALNSDYNYTGTSNQEYWFGAQAGGGVNTFGDSPWGSLDFLGSLASVDYKPRNFKIEEFYDALELATGTSFSNKPIFVPDSFIKIYI